ncbi:MAG: hypothetical protein ABMA26_03515 [Limisphaerales bacterium]
MFTKRSIWGVLLIVALFCFWWALSRRLNIPEGEEPLDPNTNDDQSASAAIRRPRATKGPRTIAANSGATNEISPPALLLGQATQSVGIAYEVFSKFTPKDVEY